MSLTSRRLAYHKPIEIMHQLLTKISPKELQLKRFHPSMNWYELTRQGRHLTPIFIITPRILILKKPVLLWTKLYADTRELIRKWKKKQ
jgi:hypothetical protein